jgi:LytS/YehU family sensor histidine kinase
MSKLDHWVDNKIVQNGFIWFSLFLILLTSIQADSRVLTSIFIILLLAPAVYINNLFILPFLRKKLPLFIGLFILNTLTFTIISVYIIKTVAYQELEFWMFVNFFGILFLAMVFASAIKIARDSFTRRQQEKEAELKLLKAQLNPHFLFNTLNNLYGLSVVKSDMLPNLMLKLSDLLRYSLYDTKESYVALEKEVEYLENYISLEKIRLENQTEIEFIKTGNLSSKKIAPMLLIVFVENAFKHLDISENKKSKVSISITEENDTITFICKNTFDVTGVQMQEIEKGKSGIGLYNAKKRLALMYPDTHQLQIDTAGTEYRVTLTLDV